MHQAVKRALVYFNLLIFLLQSTASIAGGIVATNGPSGRAHVIDRGARAPIIQINAPSAAGLSHNQFRTFNVDQRGLVVNNSARSTQTELRGRIGANRRLRAGKEARVILNEVTRANPTALNGITEIAGRQAEYIVANPYGISCNGCGFINTPDVTLTTGKPSIANGELQKLTVQRGIVAFNGQGARAGNVNNFNVISRAVELNADVQAARINMLLGRNEYNAKTGELKALVPDGSAQLAFALDSSQLGGMYAGAITLVGTEKGVGVNMSNIDATATHGNLVLTADGKIITGQLAANHTLSVQSLSNDVELQGTAYAARSTVVSAANDVRISEGAALASAEHISVNAKNLVQHGDLISGVAGSGTLSSETVAILNVEQSLTNTGTIQAGTVIADAGERIENSGGTMIADYLITKSNELDNSGGRIESGKELLLSANNIRNVEGNVAASGSSNLVAGQNLDNSDGLILLEGDESSVSAGGSIINNFGSLLHTNVNTITISAQNSVDNTDGSIGSAGVLALASGGDLFNQFGDIAATALGASVNSVDNTDGVIEVGALALEVQDSLKNENGLLSAVADVDDAMFLTIGGLLDNANGHVISNARSSSIFANEIDNTAGLISNAGDGYFVVASTGEVINTDGDIIGNGELDLWVGGLSNVRGGVQASGLLNLQVEREVDNSSGFVESGDGLILEAQRLLNRDGIISNLGFSSAMIAVDTTLDNVDGVIQSNGDHLDISAQAFNNQHGELTHSGEGWLSVFASVVNRAGEILSNGSIDIWGESLDNQSGEIASQGDTYIWTNGELDNSAGRIDAKGNVDLYSQQAIYNVAGAITAAGGDASYIVSLLDINNTDGLVYTNSESLEVTSESGNLINNGGDVMHAGDGQLSLRGVNLGNVFGQISSNGSANVQALESLDNSSGHLSAKNIHLAARQIFNNDDALAYANNMLSVDAAALINRGGTLGADSLAGFQLNSLDNTGGVMRSDDRLQMNLAWSTARQYGGIISANHTVISVNGDYHNGIGNTVQGNGSLTFNVTGDITNEGSINALGSLTLNGGDLVNQVDGVLSAELNTALNVVNLLNLGRITAGQDVLIDAADVDNYGVIAGRRDVQASVAQNFSNHDFVFAGRNMGFQIGNQLNNLDEASLFAMGSVGIAGLLPGSTAARVLNESSSIEAYNGNIFILADELINKRTVFVAEAASTPTTDQRIETDCSSGICNFIVEETLGPKILEQSAKGEILAGGDMRLVVGDLSNAHSLIAAGGDVDISGNSLDNEALDLGTVFRSSRYSGEGMSGAAINQALLDVRRWNSQFNSTIVLTLGSWRYEIEATDLWLSLIPFWEAYGWQAEVVEASHSVASASTPDSVLALLLAETTERSSQGVSSSVIQAGGTFTGSFTNALDNLSVKEGSGPLLLEIRTANTDTTGLQLAQVGITSVEQLDSSDEADRKLAELRALAGAEQGRIDVAAQRGALKLASHNPVARGISIPSGNGLFELASNLGSGVLIQTNSYYLDTSGQIGTDYLLSRVARNVDATSRRLGDGFYESRMLRDAIFYGSGRRYLEGFNNDADQFKHLMDNAVNQSVALSLEIGEALNAEQVEQLDSSIVWLVEQEVEGLRALVPVFYAAGADKKQSSAGLIASRLNLESGGDLNNDQLLSGGNLLALVSGGEINNSTGGRLQSEGTISVTAGGDINNLGGDISSGRDINIVSTGGDFNHGAETTSTTTSDQGNNRFYSWNYETTVNTAGESGALTAANNINISTVGDTTITGGDIDAGGNLSIAAGGDIAIGVAENSRSTSGTFCVFSWCSEIPSTNVVDSQEGSRVSTGGSIELRAGGDVGVVGSSLQASGDIAASGTNIAISGAGTGSDYQANSLTSGGSVFLNASDSVGIAGSHVAAANDLTIGSAQGDVSVNGVVTNTQTSTGGSFWRTSSVDSHHASSLSAGGNIVINSANDAIVSGAAVNAGEDINIQAENDVLFGSEEIKEQHDWRKYLGRRRSATEGNELTQSIITSLTSGGNVSVIAGGDLTAQGTAIHGGGDIGLSAGNALDVHAVANTSSWYSHYRGRKTRVNQGASALTHTLADIRAAGDISLTAGADAFIEGVRLNSLGNATINAGGDVDLFAVNDERSSFYEKRKKRKFGRKSHRTADSNGNTVQGTSLETDGNIAINSGVGGQVTGFGDISIVGSSLTAGGDINLLASRDLIIRAAEEKYAAQTTHKREGGTFGGRLSSAQANRKGEGSSETNQVTNISSVLSAGGNINLQARRDIILQAAKLSSQQNVSASALAGQIALLVATDIDSYSMEKEGSSLTWQSSEGEGHYDESVRMNEINANRVNFSAANGIYVEHLGEEGKDYSDEEVLSATINQLASEDEAYGYLKQLKDRNDVKWQEIVEVHEQWDYEQEGMTEVAAAIVAIVVTVLTAGAGAGAGLGVAATSSATGVTLTGGAALAANAAATSLAITATTSVINNKGNLGSTFDEVFSDNTLRGIATAALTAGALNGLGLDSFSGGGFDLDTLDHLVTSSLVSATIESGINGDSFSDNFESALIGNAISVGSSAASQSIGARDINPLGEYLLEGLVGCASAELQTSNCGGGAASAIATNLTADLYAEYIGLDGDDVGAERSYEPITGSVIISTGSSANANIAQTLSRAAGILAGNAIGGEVSVAASVASNTYNNNFWHALQREAVAFEINRPIDERDFAAYGGVPDGVDLNDPIYSQGDLLFLRHIMAVAADADSLSASTPNGSDELDSPKLGAFNWDHVVSEGWKDPKGMLSAMNLALVSGRTWQESVAGAGVIDHNELLAPLENYDQLRDQVYDYNEREQVASIMGDAIDRVGFGALRTVIGAFSDLTKGAARGVRNLWRTDGRAEARAPRVTAQTSWTTVSSDARAIARDIEAQTGLPLARNQQSQLADQVRSTDHRVPVSDDQYAVLQREYRKSRKLMISAWEENTGQVWPAGAQAHHVIPTRYGGPNQWWNIHPAMQRQHQGGVHRSGGATQNTFPTPIPRSQ